MFSKTFAPWQALFINSLYPAHALNGQPDFNNVWLTDTNNPKTGKPISDGPLHHDQLHEGSVDDLRA